MGFVLQLQRPLWKLLSFQA